MEQHAAGVALTQAIVVSDEARLKAIQALVLAFVFATHGVHQRLKIQVVIAQTRKAPYYCLCEEAL